MAKVNLTRYAEMQGISTKTAQRWFRDGKLEHPAEKRGRLILVDVPDAPPADPQRPQRTALYIGTQSESAAHEVKEWALQHGIRVDETHRSPASSPDTSSTLKRLLSDPAITRIITDAHPNADIISAALSAHGREFITTKPNRHAAPHTFKPRIASSAGA